MTSLDPSGAGGFPVELQAAAPTHAAVTGTSTCEGWLGRPGKGTLFIGEEGKPGNDLVDSEGTLPRGLVSRRYSFFSHGRMQAIATLLTAVSLLPAERAVKS